MPAANPTSAGAGVGIAAFLALVVLAAAPRNAGAGQLALLPSSADFDTVQVVGPIATRTTRIVNHGSSTTITGFTSLTGNPEFTASAPGLPATLQDLDTLVVQVTFDPVNLGPESCVFRIQDDNGISDFLGATGVGLAPTLAIFEPTLSFTSQAWTSGIPETLLVTIENQGNEPIFAPHLATQLDSGVHFRVGAMTLPILANDIGYLPVIFWPFAPGPQIDRLTISLDNDSPNLPNAIVDLNGAWHSETAVEPRATLSALRVEPSPTRGAVHVSFAAPRTGRASVEMRDAAGRVVARLDRELPSAGLQSFTLRESEWSPAPGVYFVRVAIDGLTLGHGRVAVIR